MFLALNRTFSKGRVSSGVECGRARDMQHTSGLGNACNTNTDLRMHHVHEGGEYNFCWRKHGLGSRTWIGGESVGQRGSRVEGDSVTKKICGNKHLHGDTSGPKDRFSEELQLQESITAQSSLNLHLTVESSQR